MSKIKEKMEFDFENIELEEIRLDEITGIVLQPNVKDSYGHIIDAQEIKEAAEIWNEKFQHLTVDHRDQRGSLINLNNPEVFEHCFDQDFEILSSFTTDSQSVLNGEVVPGGSWLLSLKVLNPEIFELIKEEKLSGYSIGALGIQNKNGAVRISNLIVPEVSIVQKPAHKRDFLIVKSDELEEVRKPFVSEFSCRIVDPSSFDKDSFKRIEREKDDRKFSIIIAKRPGKKTTEAQAFRYPISDWSKDLAQWHCKRQGGTFEDIKREEK